MVADSSPKVRSAPRRARDRRDRDTDGDDGGSDGVGAAEAEAAAEMRRANGLRSARADDATRDPREAALSQQQPAAAAATTDEPPPAGVGFARRCGTTASSSSIPSLNQEVDKKASLGCLVRRNNKRFGICGSEDQEEEGEEERGLKLREVTDVTRSGRTTCHDQKRLGRVGQGHLAI